MSDDIEGPGEPDPEEVFMEPEDDEREWPEDDEELEQEELLRWSFVPVFMSNRPLREALEAHARKLMAEGVIEEVPGGPELKVAAIASSVARHNGIGVLGLKHRRLVALVRTCGQPALLVADQVFFEWDQQPGGTPQFRLIAPAHHGLARAVAVGPSLGPVGVPD